MDTWVLMDVKQEPVHEEDPLDVDEEDPLDIKKDEETYFQRMEGHRDMASRVQVKLECATKEMEPEDPITGFSCPKWPRTYMHKMMCDVHMMKAHNMSQPNE